MGGGLVLYW